MMALVRLSLRTLLHSAGLIAAFLSITLLVSGVVTVVASAVGFSEPSQASEHTAFSGFVITGIVTGVCFATLFSTPLVREKEEGAVECLLATPTSVKRLWISKSIALWGPAVVVGSLCAAAVTVLLWRINAPEQALRPGGWLLLSTYVAVPLMYLVLALVVYRIAIPGRVADGSVLISSVMAGFTAVMLNLGGRGPVDPQGPWFLLVILGWAAVMAVLTVLARSGLTTEKAVA